MRSPEGPFIADVNHPGSLGRHGHPGAAAGGFDDIEAIGNASGHLVAA